MIQIAPNDTQLQMPSMALRLDFRWQSLLLHALVEPWLKSLVETSGQAMDKSYSEFKSEFETVIWSSLNWTSDTIVQMTLSHDGPTMSEVRWLLSRFENSDAGVKTLQLQSQFEGIEMDPVSVNELTRRPSNAIIDRSKDSLRQFLCRRELELHVMTEGLSRFDD